MAEQLPRYSQRDASDAWSSEGTDEIRREAMSRMQDLSYHRYGERKAAEKKMAKELKRLREEQRRREREAADNRRKGAMWQTLGTLGGTALGAAAGSVVPGVGTALGAGIGSVLGTAVGGLGASQYADGMGTNYAGGIPSVAALAAHYYGNKPTPVQSQPTQQNSNLLAPGETATFGAPAPYEDVTPGGGMMTGAPPADALSGGALAAPEPTLGPAYTPGMLKLGEYDQFSGKLKKGFDY